MTITLGFDAQTPEQISFYCLPTRTIAADTKVTVEYKQSGTSTWKTGHPLLRITPSYSVSSGPVALVDSWAGVIFDLIPGTTYDVRLTVIEPGQANVVITGTRATRALPAAAGATTKTAATSDDLQTKFDSLLPGDVLTLADGVYDWSSQPYPLRMQVAGTEASPIYIRGTSKTGTVIKRLTGFVTQMLATGHVIFEDLTIEGSSSDSGTDAQSVGVSFWNGAPGQPNVTFRRILFKGLDQGVVAFAAINGCLVYDNEFQGNNPWSKSYEINPSSDTFNYTWNDDGISLPGLGNCAWNNTLNGFGDSFSVKQEVFSAAVYFYRNRVTMTGDDACEGDYATRNFGFYDNFVTNAGTLFSSDPIYGGPTYVFRNIGINIWRGPYKLNTTGGGLLMYSNTILKTKTPGEPAGWYLSGNGAGTSLRQWAYVNNLIVYRDAGVTPTLWLEQVGNTPIDYSNNGWFPDNTSAATFKWNVGGNFASLAEAAAGIAITAPIFGTTTRRHTGDVVSVSDPFATDITISSNYQTEFSGTPSVALSTGTTLSNAGVVIPGITDGYSGVAPDIGAAISGRAAITYGASSTGGDTTPVIDTPTKSTPTSTSAVVGFSTTTTAGTASAVLTLSATQPSAAQVKAGQDGTGSASGVVVPPALTVSSAGAKSFASATVGAGLTYYGWIVLTGTGNLDSTVLAVGKLYPGTGRPVTDLSVNGFTPSSGSSLSDMLNEDTANDSTYITSPALSATPVNCILSLNKSYPAGTYSGLKIREWVSSGTATLRVRLLNDSNVAVGVTADQTINSTPTTYTLPITITGTATRYQIEIEGTGSAPAPAPSPAIVLTATGDATVGVAYSITATAANLTTGITGTPENVTGSATFTPTTISPAPGELSKLFSATYAAAGSASVRVTAPGIVSNTLLINVVAAPAPAPSPTTSAPAVASGGTVLVAATSAGTGWTELSRSSQGSRNSAADIVSPSQHAGAVWDNARGRMWIVGAETHAYVDYGMTNAPYYWDAATGQFGRMHDHDDSAAYRVGADGIWYGNAAKTRPAAMHVYNRMRMTDAGNIELSYPAQDHLYITPIQEGAITAANAITPFWTYSPTTGLWSNDGAPGETSSWTTGGSASNGSSSGTAYVSGVGWVLAEDVRVRVLSDSRVMTTTVVAGLTPGVIHNKLIPISGNRVVAMFAGDSATLCVIHPLSALASTSTKLVSAYPALSGHDVTSCGSCLMPDGRILFTARNASGQFKAFIFDVDANTVVSTGHTITPTQPGYQWKFVWATSLNCALLCTFDALGVVSVWSLKL